MLRANLTRSAVVVTSYLNNHQPSTTFAHFVLATPSIFLFKDCVRPLSFTLRLADRIPYCSLESAITVVYFTDDVFVV